MLIMGITRNRRVKSGQPAKPSRPGALMIRISDEERRIFERAAAIVGISTSSWARMILLREVRRESTDEPR
jgi:predicted HicB family RNase H-like nuclease